MSPEPRSAPVTFRRRALDIRHRLPDRSGQGFSGPKDRLVRGVLSPRAVRGGSGYDINRMCLNIKSNVANKSATRALTPRIHGRIY